MFIFDNVIMKGGNEMKKRTLVLAALLTLGFAMKQRQISLTASTLNLSGLLIRLPTLETLSGGN